ncbi:phospholipase A [uncultured Maribacter sp.]|uniref:phospholipase A n=1 Tax=uncultured Maribacter sp. TaxID=431308 RepID=UPI002608C52D|nr:phospholipase A [uncultured Maribacter sp.]
MKVFCSLFLFFFAIVCSFGQSLIQDPGGKLSQRWQIQDDTTKLFKIVPYKPVYFLVANYTSNINKQPTSSNPLNSAAQSYDYLDTEFKFQISFKARVAKNLFGNKLGGDLWAGYTQSSRWQLYSSDISRPFRETNYEPEVIFVLPVKYSFLGVKGVYTAIGINHQSNGKANPLSRSWNRVVAQIGWESPSWSFVLSPWWRIQEESIEDNNPNVENYIGRAELLSAYAKGRHNISVLLRHSLRAGNNNKGSAKIDYAVRVFDLLEVHAQLFYGYGESLIDYNHKQTTFGLGVSLLQWK